MIFQPNQNDCSLNKRMANLNCAKALEEPSQRNRSQNLEVCKVCHKRRMEITDDSDDAMFRNPSSNVNIERLPSDPNLTNNREKKWDNLTNGHPSTNQSDEYFGQLREYTDG